MSLIVKFKIHKMSFKMSFIARCFGLMRPSLGNYQLQEITILYRLTHLYYHAITALHRMRNVCLHFPHVIFMYSVHIVFLVCGFPRQACVPDILWILNVIISGIKKPSSIECDIWFIFSFTLTCFGLYWPSSEGYLSVYISTVQRLLPMF
jgi:hypothetical protein